MKSKLLLAIVGLIFFLGTSASGFASSVRLQWVPNTENDLAGYKLYYKQGSSTEPFNGIGAIEGNAPVDVLNQTTAIISGLDSGTTYYFAVTAYNTAGLESTYSNVVAVTITLPDTSAPMVAVFTIPSSASSLTVPITTFTANDNVGVTGYLLTQSKTTIPVLTDTGWTATAPASFTFSRAGSNLLYAWVKDAAGNISNGIGRSVTITLPDSIPPTIKFSTPTGGTIVSGGVTIATTASDNIGVTRVELYINGMLTKSSTVTPVSYIWDTTTLSSGSYTVSTKAYDAAGNMGQSTIQVMVNNDKTPPVVVITSPAGGATVAGTTTVNVATSDNVGVSKVELYINGQLAGTKTTAPYTFTWNTASQSLGTHSLVAYAYDAAGNRGQSILVQVSIKDTIAPSVTVKSPPDASRIGSSTTISATATDNVNVVQMRIYIDGRLYANSNTSSISYRWRSSRTYRGAHTIAVEAFDAAGNVGRRSLTVYK